MRARSRTSSAASPSRSAPARSAEWVARWQCPHSHLRRSCIWQTLCSSINLLALSASPPCQIWGGLLALASCSLHPLAPARSFLPSMLGPQSGQRVQNSLEIYPAGAESLVRIEMVPVIGLPHLPPSPSVPFAARTLFPARRLPRSRVQLLRASSSPAPLPSLPRSHPDSGQGDKPRFPPPPPPPLFPPMRATYPFAPFCHPLAPLPIPYELSAVTRAKHRQCRSSTTPDAESTSIRQASGLRPKSRLVCVSLFGVLSFLPFSLFEKLSHPPPSRTVTVQPGRENVEKQGGRWEVVRLPPFA
jgi:hypothetical protein